MTTIATDGKTMAADTQQSGAFIGQIDATKLYKIKGVVYGFAGTPSIYIKYVEWVKLGRPEDDKPDTEDKWSVIYIVDGTIWYEHHTLIPIKVGYPYATGSGCKYAMGAMLAGATPGQAVKIAIKLDSDTGGKVRTMKCGA